MVCAAFFFARGVSNMISFDRRFWFVVAALLGVVMLCAMRNARAIDTSTCGWLACEAVVPGNSDPLPPPAREDECREGPEPNKRIEDWYRTWCDNCPGWSAWAFSGTSFAQCNCSAQPPIPAGDAFATTESGNAYCNAGCQYVVDGPGICWGPPNGGGSRVCSVAVVPSGVNCNPVSPPPPEPPPPTGTECFDSGTGSQVCLTPLVAPPDLPQICGTRDGNSVGCVVVDECSTGEAGSLCAGEPAPSPPPTNDDPPRTYPEPDVSVTVTYCSGPGACSEIHVESSGPPDSPPPEPCPEGSHREGGACVQSPRCPDGSSPVGGSCPAPVGNCPDGSRPVNGTCPAVGGGDSGAGCPPGQVDVGGTCFAPCADGSAPVAGACPAPVGTCPSGATPVNGRCEMGSPCDPATDPNGCSGEGNNAGGGLTCGAAPYCTGDLALCSIQFQSWKTRCAIEALNPSVGPTEGDYGTTYTSGQAWGNGDSDGGDGSTLDASGWLGGGGDCPALPTVTFMDSTFSMDEWLPCSTLHILSVLILLGGYVQAAFIIGGRK